MLWLNPSFSTVSKSLSNTRKVCILAGRYESLFILDAKLLCDVAELALIVREDLSASHRVRKHSIEQVRDLSRMDRAKLGVATGFFMKYI